MWKLIIFSLAITSIITIMNIAGRNLIILLLAVELLFFSGAVACLVCFYAGFGSNWNVDLLFMALALTVLAAAESAVGLALVALLHRRTGSIIIKKK